jgi:hypothetical protein
MTTQAQAQLMIDNATALTVSQQATLSIPTAPAADTDNTDTDNTDTDDIDNTDDTGEDEPFYKKCCFGSY